MQGCWIAKTDRLRLIISNLTLPSHHCGPFDARNIFDDTPEGPLSPQPMKIDWT
jgi:hypothetical protein